VVHGRVLFTGSEADIQKNTLPVKVAIADPPNVFKPEMLVEVTFLADQPPEQSGELLRETKLYLPGQLIQQDDAGFFVWVADQTRGVARQKRIEKGVASGSGLVEITSGLNLADRLIVGGSNRLRDGDRIKVTAEDNTFGMGMETGSGGQVARNNE
jgi:HlyD family secretion protein